MGVPLRLVVMRAAELAPGRTAKFSWEAAGRRRNGFVVNWRGRLRAYVNECCHIPISLDYFDNDFLDAEGRYLVCANHGALYEPDTGRCVAGPPLGAALEPLRVAVEGEDLVVYVERPEEPGRGDR